MSQSQLYDSLNADIRVKIGEEWSPASADQKAAYIAYKSRHHYYRETPYTHETGISIFRENNNSYMATYFKLVGSVRNPNAKYPIIDMNDISVFIITSMDGADWLPCREYQAWAYRDFVYDEHRNIKKSYMSQYSSHMAFNNTVLVNQVVTIPVSNIAPNIVFNISRNENNSVYFERNDATGSRVRMCDNEYARSGYRGFYTRITMDVGAVVVPPPPGWGGGPAVYYNLVSSPPVLLSTVHLPAPEETDDEEHQCILCFKFSVNARFSPCEHQVCCSACYSKMVKNECPVCRAVITRVMNI
jgi:hypothetical protein